MAKDIMLIYDTKKMNAEIPITDVIRRYKGYCVENTKHNIPCPSASHTDNHPSAHIYGNTCHCFACGRNFSPITLAKEYYSGLTFPEMCKQFLSDFGASVYAYSNYGEVEKQLAAKENNEYYEVFPLTEQDLKQIGLYNPKPQSVEMSAKDYFMLFTGTEPTYDERFDNNGREITYKVSYNDAVKVGYSANVSDLPTIQEMWLDDKKSVEELIKSHCEETLDNLDTYAQQLSEKIVKYEKTHTEEQINDTRTIYDAYIKVVGSGGNVRLSESQSQRISELLEYNELKFKLSNTTSERQSVMDIVDKLITFFDKREEHVKTEKDSKKQTIER